MRPEQTFEIVFGHCVFQATRLRNAVSALMGDGTGGFPEDQACYLFIKEGHATLVNALSSADGATDLVRTYASVPPVQGMHDALLHWEAVPDLMQAAVVAVVMDALTRWHVQELHFAFHGGKIRDQEPSPPEIEGKAAYDALLGLHCLMGGQSLEQAEADLSASALHLIETLAEKFRVEGDDQPESGRPDEKVAFIASIGTGLDRVGASAWRYHELIRAGRRFALIDLESPMIGHPRHQLGELAKQWTQELAVASHVDRYRLVAQAVIGEAATICAWTPPEMEPRRVALKPPSSAIMRRCVRVISMVHELHKAGYQRIRMLPFSSPSGFYWRAWITFSDNIADDGYNLIDHDLDDTRGLTAKYTSAQDNEFFGWCDAKNASARKLAQLFIDRFPIIADRGRGVDWAYAGWLVDLLGHAEQFDDGEGLIALIYDGPKDAGLLRRWRPPPPIRF